MLERLVWFVDVSLLTIAPHRLWPESLASQLGSFIKQLITECLQHAKNHFRVKDSVLEDLVFYVGTENKHTYNGEYTNEIGREVKEVQFYIGRPGKTLVVKCHYGKYLRKECFKQMEC